MKLSGRRVIVEYKNRRSRKEAGSLWGDINLKAIAKEVDENASLSKRGAKPAISTVPNKTTSAEQRSFKKQALNVPLSVATERDSVHVRPEETLPDLAKSPAKPRIIPAIFQSNIAEQQNKSTAGDKGSTTQAQNTTKSVKKSKGSASPSKAKKVKSSSALDNQPIQGVFTKKTQVSVVSTKEAAISKEPNIKAPAKTRKISERSAALFGLLVPDMIDDLPALEAENTKLKLRLIKKLGAQNKQLKQMIARASKPID